MKQIKSAFQGKTQKRYANLKDFRTIREDGSVGSILQTDEKDKEEENRQLLQVAELDKPKAIVLVWTAKTGYLEEPVIVWERDKGLIEVI